MLEDLLFRYLRRARSFVYAEEKNYSLSCMSEMLESYRLINGSGRPAWTVSVILSPFKSTTYCNAAMPSTQSGRQRRTAKREKRQRIPMGATWMLPQVRDLRPRRGFITASKPDYIAELSLTLSLARSVLGPFTLSLSDVHTLSLRPLRIFVGGRLLVSTALWRSSSSSSSVRPLQNAEDAV